MRCLIFLVLAIAAGAAPASASSYVACDNGLRCFASPCPSTNVLDVRALIVRQGIYLALDRLSPADRNKVEQANASYNGALVLKGDIKNRTITAMGKQHQLPHLVATAIERQSTATERHLCRSAKPK